MELQDKAKEEELSKTKAMMTERKMQEIGVL